MIAVHARKQHLKFGKEIVESNSNFSILPNRISNSWLKQVEAVIFISFAGAILSKQLNILVKNQIPIIYLDTGIFNQYSKNNYLSLCVDGFKYLGLNYIKYNFDPYAWDKLNKNLNVDYNNFNNGKEYSILMHNKSSPLSTKRARRCVNIHDIQSSLRKNKKSFQVSQHPNGMGKTFDIETIVKTSKCCIGWHSNALCIAALHRIPVLCLDKISFASPVSCEGIKKLSVPTNEKRIEWLNFISNSQFTKEQILDCSFMNKIRPYIEIVNEKREISNL